MQSRTHAPARRTGLLAWVVASVALLAGCGGGDGSVSAQTVADPAPAQRLAATANATDMGDGLQGGALNAAELLQAREAAQAANAATSSGLQTGPAAGDVAPLTAYENGAVARKAMANRLSVFRFHNTRTGAHFYTSSLIERATVISTLPYMRDEGTAFSAASAYSPGLLPVHRFFNNATGVHFYTISEAERARIAATMSSFTYEGVAYHASAVGGVGFVPLYRFYLPARGFHFYTASESERDSIRATLSSVYRYEGVGYHVLTSDWAAPAVPHTGVLDSRCYQAGSSTLAYCYSAAAQGFNAGQDGQRRRVNPMDFRYVALSNSPGFVLIYPSSDCVRDTVTHLMWEGKPNSGSRSEGRLFTHYDDTTQNQVTVGLGVRAPTAAELDASTNSLGYVREVNASGLCGFSDWRLPTWQELQSIVDFNRGGSADPAIDPAWFPNTSANVYWTSSPSRDAQHAVGLNFFGGEAFGVVRSEAKRLRLVRGPSSAGFPNRFTFTRQTMGAGETGDNLVVDNLTGLTWRRCSLGQLFNGSTCTGVPTRDTHEDALRIAQSIASSVPGGWRLPSVKELASISRPGTDGAFDPVVFPSTDQSVFGYWASTPYWQAASAWTLRFGDPGAVPQIRGVPGGLGGSGPSYAAIRLVRSTN
jgi:Protein of unknown function (DUF1566)/Repeat of unknown function (DUF5648)